MEPNKRIRHKQQTLAQGKDFKRWRLWRCIQGSEPHRRVEAREEIAWLELKGYKAKIWTPLPQHKTSGHTHVVILCTFTELCTLQGIDVNMEKLREQH
jgi:hypothetical protein